MLRMPLLIGLLACLHISAAPATQPIFYHEELKENPLLHIHMVRIDLSDPRISLHVTRGGETDPDGTGEWQCTLSPTSMVARREDYAVAINANFFAVKETREILGRQVPYFYGNWAKAIGWAVAGGQTICDTRGDASLVVLRSGEVQLKSFAAPLADVKEAISGSPALVINGKINPNILIDAPAPRTGVGLDKSRKILTLIVVDGRRPEYSAGLSVRDFAQLFLNADCENAVNLDGGGSSTLVMRNPGGRTWSVKNRPSDGHGLPGDPSIERSVAVIFGVKYDEPR